MFQRSSGVLIHITSLPGPFGIGDLGPSAYELIEMLAASGTRYWQMLPLNPLGFGASPYASPSSRAGNDLLISPELLAEDGLVDPVEPMRSGDRVRYGPVADQKRALIAESASRLTEAHIRGLSDFRDRERDWLEPYSLFMAIKNAHGNASWVGWPTELRRREAGALAVARELLSEEMRLIELGQYLFHDHLMRLRNFAGERGVGLIGDLPIYVATDSVDVWTRPELFSIDPMTSELTDVAGVPADPLSPTGQEWGMPTYRWERHFADGFSWWIDRLRRALQRSDVLRIDHFTGFYRYYSIPADSRDPRDGDWLEGPGMAFFERLRSELGDLPMIAEDIGPIMEEVDRFRRRVGFPGIRVLLEAFDGQGEPTRKPENYPVDCVVYTGTHDYDSAMGWLASADDSNRRLALSYTRGGSDTFAFDLITRAWESPQVVAVAPMQDLLGLGSEARMNAPGTVDSNWEWRLSDFSKLGEVADLLTDLNTRFGRNRTGD